MFRRFTTLLSCSFVLLPLLGSLTCFAQTPFPNGVSSTISQRDASGLEGKWSGTVTGKRQFKGSQPSYSFKLDVHVSGNSVNGTSRIEDNSGHYGVMAFTATLKEGILAYSETEIIQQKPVPDTFWCIKHGALTFSGNTLSGEWDDPGCNAGTVNLQKQPSATPDDQTPEPDVCPFCKSIILQKECSSPAAKEYTKHLCHELLGAFAELGRYRAAYIINPTFINLFPTSYYNVTLIELHRLSHGAYDYPIEKMEQMLAFYDAYKWNRDRFSQDNEEEDWKRYYDTVVTADQEVDIRQTKFANTEHLLEVQKVLESGISAHVIYDLPRALRFSHDHGFNPTISTNLLHDDFARTDETIKLSAALTEADLRLAYSHAGSWLNWVVSWAIPSIDKILGETQSVIYKRNRGWTNAFDGMPLLLSEDSQPITDHNALEIEGKQQCGILSKMLR